MLCASFEAMRLGAPAALRPAPLAASLAVPTARRGSAAPLTTAMVRTRVVHTLSLPICPSPYVIHGWPPAIPSPVDSLPPRKAADLDINCLCCWFGCFGVLLSRNGAL